MSSTPTNQSHDRSKAQVLATTAIRSLAGERAGDLSVAMVDAGTAFISKLRWRALAWVLAIALAAFGTVSFISVGWVAAISVALAAAAVSVNRIASTLDKDLCRTCGHDMATLAAKPATYGVTCPVCGGIHERVPRSNDPKPESEAALAAVAAAMPDGEQA